MGLAFATLPRGLPGRGERVSKLDNHDKHKLLVPAFSITRLEGVSGFGPNNNRFKNNTLEVGAGGQLNFLGMNGPITITNPGRRVFSFYFQHGQFFTGEPVIPTLERLAKLTRGVIDALEAHMQGSDGRTIFAAVNG